MSYSNLCTIWREGSRDAYGHVTYESGVYRSVDQVGSSQKITDSKGEEFVPTAKFWSKLEHVSGAVFIPTEGDYIVRGEFAGSVRPENTEAQAIRKRVVYDNSMFGQASEYMFAT